MVDFNSLLAQKYAIKQQEADAASLRAQAEANVQNQQAAQIQQNAISNRALQGANTNLLTKQFQTFDKSLNSRLGLEGAQSRNLISTADERDALLPGRIGLQGSTMEAQGAQTDALRRGTDYEYGDGSESLIGKGLASRMSLGIGATAPRSSGYSSITDSTLFNPRSLIYGFAKGTARVPGKGSPAVDKVPAKLAPGEAVLNQPAADMMGRGLIAALNAHGAQKLGMV